MTQGGDTELFFFDFSYCAVAAFSERVEGLDWQKLAAAQWRQQDLECSKSATASGSVSVYLA